MAGRGKSGVPHDLVLLNDVSDDAILDALGRRFSAGEFMTFIGEVLINVNPYTWSGGQYGSSVIRKYAGKKLYENAPHYFAIAEMAYRAMLLGTANQCVIITGESGSGKTEASKKVMDYVAAMASKSREVQTIKDRLLETNPLLEAFGNAKTVRNDNSSRFGKYMEIQFLYSDPCGGKIKTYLLEKTRVTGQNEGERNFHVFYQLLSDSSARSNFSLSRNPSDYRYLTDASAANVRGMDDSSWYTETRKAMDFIGLGGNDQTQVFAILAGILHLGNVEFRSAGRDASTVADRDALSKAAGMLGVNERDLATALTHRTVKSATESVRTGLSVEKAEFARDSLAKGLYGRLFDFLVARANDSLLTGSYSTSIGILDIYGFEILGVNGFEQLCINYTNEKLHNLYVELTLSSEQKIYAAEGVQWQKVPFKDNSDVLKLVEGRGQLLALIDEESIFPQGSDDSLHRKLTSQMRSRMFSTRGKGLGPTMFTVEHYAGVVTYDTVGMLESNKDQLYPDLVLTCYHTSRNEIVKALWADHPVLQRSKTNARAPTTANQYKKSMAALMDTLRGNQQHYIRCIKPNESKRAGLFEPHVIEQVRYLGLAESLLVRRAGFAFRMTYPEFASKYKATLRNQGEFNPDARAVTAKVIKEHSVRDHVMGRTMVFVKNARDILQIEDERRAFMDRAAGYLPDGDGLLYADQVLAFDSKTQRRQLLFVIGGRGIYTFDLEGRQTEHFVSFDEMEGIGINEREGWVGVYTTYPGKTMEDPQVQVTYLCANLYASEIENVFTEVLPNVGIEVPISKTQSSPPLDAVDAAAFKANKKLIGNGAMNLPTIGNGGKKVGAGGCCTIC